MEAQIGNKLLLVTPNCADLAKPNVEIKRFPDGETYVRIDEETEGKHVTVLHRCYPKQDSSLLQLLLIGNAVAPFAKSLTAVVPYLPYARQDKAWKTGEVKSAEIVCNLLVSSGYTNLVTYDCHFLKKGGEHKRDKLTILNKSMGKMLEDYLSRQIADDPVIVSPDSGAGYLVEGRGHAMKKVRGEYVTDDKTAYREVKELSMDFSVNGREVIVLDDMIAGGGTMERAVRLCIEAGAKTVRCGATHGLFLNFADQRIKEAGAQEVIASDTVQCPYSKVSIKEQLFTAPLSSFF
jgi:ribose-phosphate pyrophosphokinase